MYATAFMHEIWLRGVIAAAIPGSLSFLLSKKLNAAGHILDEAGRLNGPVSGKKSTSRRCSSGGCSSLAAPLQRLMLHAEAREP